MTTLEHHSGGGSCSTSRPDPYYDHDLEDLSEDDDLDIWLIRWWPSLVFLQWHNFHIFCMTLLSVYELVTYYGLALGLFLESTSFVV